MTNPTAPALVEAGRKLDFLACEGCSIADAEVQVYSGSECYDGAEHVMHAGVDECCTALKREYQKLAHATQHGAELEKVRPAVPLATIMPLLRKSNQTWLRRLHSIVGEEAQIDYLIETLESRRVIGELRAKIEALPRFGMIGERPILGELDMGQMIKRAAVLALFDRPETNDEN